MTLKYVGAARDYSGYGEAARHDIVALITAGVDVTTKIPRYTLEIADFGAVGEAVEETENRALPYDIVLLHTTPNVYRQYMEQGKYHIARAFWETDKVPMDFAVNLQACDEIWTGSEFNKRAMEAAGITKPIYLIPEAIEIIDPEQIPAYKAASDGTYKFYSMFEWTERKNPEALLRAYFAEFQNDENVSLTIKTYIDNFSRAPREEIDSHIRLIKQRLGQAKYPPLYLYRELMDRDQIRKFHKSHDCFVSAHRGEGWGIPQMEALMLNKPVISTNCGGIHEYLQDKTDALLIPHNLVQLTNNNRNQQWYTPDQNWADVDILALRAALRSCFEDQEGAKKMGITGGNTVREKFNFNAVGQQMKARLEQIEGSLHQKNYI